MGGHVLAELDELHDRAEILADKLDPHRQPHLEDEATRVVVSALDTITDQASRARATLLAAGKAAS